MSLDDIDFAALYREQMQRAGWAHRPADAWDGRATEYGRNSGRSRYAEDFIARMDLSGARTLLDVGCGPGTLALPLARRLEHVHAIDYSGRMLLALHDKAREDGIGNVTTQQLAWEDDWHAVPVCDIAIASRSTTIGDLGAGLQKLASRTRLRAYLTYLVGGRFIDAEILRLAAAELLPMPDHLLVLGMLHRMDIHPRVDFIETPSRLAGSTDFDDFAQRLAWSTGALDEAARERLKAWYEHDPARAGGSAMRWAFISWEAAGSGMSTGQIAVR